MVYKFFIYNAYIKRCPNKKSGKKTESSGSYIEKLRTHETVDSAGRLQSMSSIQ